VHWVCGNRASIWLAVMVDTAVLYLAKTVIIALTQRGINEKATMTVAFHCFRLMMAEISGVSG
jgi:hypothetical protein